ncbi:MAG: 50S ribosomal protein L25/general stress protein Ctc [Proteobacteria bacterium]|nr:50S ribosomal protein L25/general stress protein Ctc [Pseudomonadota bacterium]MBU4470917.1 50S ribosomal protein L25/general stress protein Ctc [Pseudomonadota bacterium]MCG2751915.1 50S ribosomal protein L25/general stress protein Ctc [Desulfobacteraceae bacterium]
MEVIELNAAVRTTVGNGPARALRRDGRIPAVLYGPVTPPVMLSVQTNELEKALKRGKIGQTLFNLAIDNAKNSSKTVMIKELQGHPMTGKYLHADFYEVDMNRKITVNIPVHTIGKAKGVEDGGVLQIVRRELEVTCLPIQIPQSIVIDISGLDIGDSVHVEDIPVQDGIEIPYDVNFTVITLLAPKADERSDAEGVEDTEGEGSESSEA